MIYFGKTIHQLHIKRQLHGKRIYIHIKTHFQLEGATFIILLVTDEWLLVRMNPY